MVTVAYLDEFVVLISSILYNGMVLFGRNPCRLLVENSKCEVDILDLFANVEAITYYSTLCLVQTGIPKQNFKKAHQRV